MVRVDHIPKVFPKQLRGRVAENLLRCGIQIPEFAILMDEDYRGERFSEGEKLPVGLARHAFGTASIGYLQSMAVRRHEAVQSVFEDVISRPTGQGGNGQFFPANTRNKNEGNLRR